MGTTNINQFLFTRTAPQKKLAVINNLSQYELLNVTTATITRIIKEAGYGKKGSPNKTLRLTVTVGNDWNSDVESIYVWKGKLYIDFYLQYSNTDTSTEDTWSNFIYRGDYRGSYKYTDRYDNPQTAYFTYDEEDKARVIKAILKSYIKTKYASKLKDNGSNK